MENKLVQRGSFKWDDVVKTVIYVPDPKGKWLVTKHPSTFKLKK